MAEPVPVSDDTGAPRPAPPGPTPPPVTRAPLPPIVRRSNAAAAPPAPPSLLRRALDLVAPWILLLAAAAPFATAYRLTLLSGTPRFAFAHPLLLALLALVPALALWLFHLARRRQPTMLYTRLADLRATPPGAMRYLVRLPQVLRLLSLALLIVALARPQHESADVVEVEGIDIVIALDVSNSMSEQDMDPDRRPGVPGADRLSAAKRVLGSFIDKRKSDRIGLVIFGRDAFTQCPLTLDYHALSTLLESVRLGLVDGRGTAIGNALATALNRLRKSDAKSKVIILLTDGDNNAGNISPQQAAKFAQSLGVKVFTVLIGRDADIEASPFMHAQPRYPVNPKLLEEIAGATGGSPYLATDGAALEKRFQSILDELDRSRIKDQRGKPRELFVYFAIPALGLLLVELLLSLTRFRRWP